MKDDLDRLLQGLGGVEAPMGLEMRVLARLEDAEIPRRHTARTSPWIWSCASAFAAAILLAGIMTNRRTAHSVAVTSEHHVERTLDEGTTRTVSPSVAPEAVHDVRPQQQDEVVIRQSISTQTVAEVRVETESGFPAPEAPLSEQERLLLRLAQRPTPATLAIFDDDVRTRRAEAEKAELDLLNPVQPLVGPRADETEIKEKHDDDVYAKR